ncbi:hypothetical protein [Nocardia crassostreae]|uniref:hypothetical protein n=1 Tax=Nocardia crassostreae TaxID=53428 RepID=UPI00082E35CA|nr:hypothetical protein [Nocardia crassostreae]
MIKQFMAHRTSSKAHIYAVNRRSGFWARADGLELETTVGRDHLSLVDDLITDLNMYLADPERKDPSNVGHHQLRETLGRMPTAVADSVERFIRSRCGDARLGEYGEQGPIYPVDWYPAELDELPAGWNGVDELFNLIIGNDDLAVRWEIVAGYDGRLEWEPEARTERPHVSYDDPHPSGWTPPHGLEPSIVWTSWVIGELQGDIFTARPIHEGLQIASDAFDAGKLARIYPVWTNLKHERPHANGSMGSASVEWIIEVFDELPATRDNADREEPRMTDAVDIRSATTSISIDPFDDELANRRHQQLVERLKLESSIGGPPSFEHLVDCLQVDMRSGLEPDNRGFGGELVLDVALAEAIIARHGLAALRKVARQAARNLGWQPKTHLSHGRFLVYDARDIPEDVSARMSRRSAEVVQAVITGRPHPGEGGGLIPAAHRLGISVRAAFESIPDGE